jgi:rare lipoprotein A
LRGRAAGTAGSTWSLRGALHFVAVAASCALVGCAMPPATDAEGGNLQPLPRAMAVPPGAAPRSNVPSVRYDLAVSGADELTPDDGVPGDDGPRDIFERGGASWYGIQFHQRKTASGERFDMTAMTAAHKTLPFNTRVCVRSLVNGSEVLVRINDRGPYALGRVIDLSRAAADRIGLTGLGIKQVALTVVDHDGQRCGGLPVEAGDAQAPVASAVEPQQRARVQVPARRKVIVPARRRK